MRRVESFGRNIEMSDTVKQSRSRANMYLAMALGSAVLILYLLAFTIDWPGLWQSVEKQRSEEKR